MEYQIELLRKSLGEKVKGVHLGSSYEVKDPISRRLERKPLKPFLVNQVTMILERGQLRIPNTGIEETIHRQMTNYQVVKVSPKNQEPVYTSEDEHSLDAMTFSLFAFLEQYPDLVNTVQRIEPAKLVGIKKRKTKDPLQEMPSFNGEENDTNETEWTDDREYQLKKVKVGSVRRKGNGGEGMFGTWGNRQSMRNRPTHRKGMRF